jgi:hypothetical protein
VHVLKRLSYIFISLLLVVATSGVTISKHFCGGSLVSTSIFANDNVCCGSHCNSCHDEVFSFKVIDNYVSSSFKIDQPREITFDWLVAFSSDLFYPSLQSNFLLNQIWFLEASPPIVDNPSALLQVFRC